MAIEQSRGYRIYLSALAVVTLSVWTASGGELIPLLKAGTQTYTNAIVEQVTATHLFVRHYGGLSTVSLKELDPETQKKFGYTPEVAETAEASHGKGAAKAGASNDQGLTKSDGIEQTNSVESARVGFTTKDFAIGKQGALSLVFPKRWKDTCQSASVNGTAYITVRFEPDFGSNIVVLVTSLPANSKLKQFGARGALELAGTSHIAESDENRLIMKELTGMEIDGLYFTLSDKKLEQGPQKSGKHKYVTQGFVTIGDFALSFVILYDYPDCMEQRAALQIIQTAQFKKPE
jgi:hypothetical protein